MQIQFVVVIFVLTFFITGIGSWYFIHYLDTKTVGSASKEAERIKKEAETEAEAQAKDILLKAKDRAEFLRNEADREIKHRKKDSERHELKLQRKEDQLDSKFDNLQKRQENLDKKEKRIVTLEQELDAKVAVQDHEIERIAGLTQEQAKEFLLERTDKKLDLEYAKRIAEHEARIREDADRQAKKLVTLAIQRTAVDHVAETTTSEVKLTSDDMKGRIIGREGRNIRTFETLTGVEVIIDDTPEAVVLSAFDPVRRAIAKLTLEKLVQDGRIHPSRIEESYEKAKVEIDKAIWEVGQQAVLEVGIGDVNPELIKLLGRLKYRTSYGQNILMHSIEVANLTGNLAAELGTNPTLARRCGLLHDIGKAVDHDVQGTHAAIGAELARKYKEPKGVVHAIAAHHAEIEQKTIEAILVQAADAISAARPGVRGETLSSYIRRLSDLEGIAGGFAGVDRCYAIQAGREIRIIVVPEEVDDALTPLLARQVADKIEEQLDYPGQIKVTVIREVRAHEIAS
ncbi:MAG: ribonuclease Y [bacterium]|nr:ribonuclease Y [bacterium]